MQGLGRQRRRYKNAVYSAVHYLFICFRFGLVSLKKILVATIMAPVLSFIVGSLLAVRAFAEPFEKLFDVPEGELHFKPSFGLC